MRLLQKKKIDSTEEPCQTGAISHTKSRSEAKTFRAFYHPRPRLGVSVKKKKIVYILLFINLTSGGQVKIILSRIQVFCLSTFKTDH